MTVRQRHRRTQAETEAREWEQRRAYVMDHAPDDHLLTAEEYWRREPGVPDELRRPARQRWLIAERAEDQARLRAEYTARLEARRAWLTR